MAPGLQRPPASGGAIRGGGRRRRAGVLGPRQASPREQSMAWELWFYLAGGVEGLFRAPSRAGEGAASPATAVIPEALSIERRRSWPGMLPSEPPRLRRPPSGRRVRLAGPRGARWAGSGAPDRPATAHGVSWPSRGAVSGGERADRSSAPPGSGNDESHPKARSVSGGGAGGAALHPAGPDSSHRLDGDSSAAGEADQGHAILPALPASSGHQDRRHPLGARAV